MPLPKFEDEEKYKEETIRVLKDLRILYLKERIKEISKDLKSKKNNFEIESIRLEIEKITSQISAS